VCFSAETALATLQGHPIPGLSPPVVLVLSPYPPTTPPTPLPPPSASPRLVKHLPPNYTDPQLFDLFRSFGALASVRAQTGFGQDTGLVEFWREEDARRAEEALHCAEIEGQNIAVQLYNRRGSGILSEFSPRAPPFVPSGSAYPSPYPTQVSFQSLNRRPLSHSQSVFAPKSEPIPSSFPSTVHSWSGPAGPTRTPSWSRV
jgi:polyadenylate-binding protein